MLCYKGTNNFILFAIWISNCPACLFWKGCPFSSSLQCLLCHNWSVQMCMSISCCLCPALVLSVLTHILLAGKARAPILSFIFKNIMAIFNLLHFQIKLESDYPIPLTSYLGFWLKLHLIIISLLEELQFLLDSFSNLCLLISFYSWICKDLRYILFWCIHVSIVFQPLLK